MLCIKENKIKKFKFVFIIKSIKFILSLILRCILVGGVEGVVFFDIIDNVLLLKFEY